MMEKDYLVGDSLKIMPPQYLPMLYRGELLRNDTSGSTGKCLEIYWTKEDYMRSMYSLWFYRKKFYGINPWDKRCRFYTIFRNGSNEEKSRYVKNALEFSKSDLTEDRLLEIYYEMCEYRPVWLILQPCVAELLCMVKEKYGLPDIDSIKYIEMTGEELTDRIRTWTKDVFQCPVANQYGANEVNSIAYECPHGNLHCMESNVKVEIRNEDGDLVPDGQRVTPYVFVRAVDAVNAAYDNCIFQFQVTQEEYDKFIIKLAVDEWNKEMSAYFVECIGQKELRTAFYEFRLFETLFPEFNGKRSYFKCKVK